MRILILRHGETDHNVNRIMQGTLDTPLNSRGEEQARDVGRILKQKERVDAVFSSDLQRAKRTAELVAPNLKVNTIKELRERYMGPLQNMHYNDAVAKMELEGKKSLKEYGESLEEMEQRLSNGWDILLKNAENYNTVLMVSHGSALTTLFAYLVRENKVRFLNNEVKNAFDKNPRLSNCCVTTIEDGVVTGFAEKWTSAIERERDLL